MNLGEKLELILESSINNQQFVCREKKKIELEGKTKEKLERIMAALGLVNYVMRQPPRSVFIERLTLVYIGFVWLQG